MAFRTWARLLGATLGVGALAGASQLGLAYGLGILRLTRVVDVTARDQWTAQLAWVAWYAMTAAVVGALVGRLQLPAHAGPGTRIATALAAGLGGAVVVPLTMQPARTAQVDGVHPVFVIGVCAGIGATAGIIAAYAALTRAASRWSLIAIGVAVWVLAIASVAPSMAPGDPLPAVRLGVFDAGYLPAAVVRRTALLTMPALALVCGAVLGWVARRRAMSTLTIALAGLPGPALLTVAYLIAGPGSGRDQYEVVPYWAAMTAAGAGVLGSVLAAVVRRGPGSSAGPSSGPDDPERIEDGPGAIEDGPGRNEDGPKRSGDDPRRMEPTPDRPPLPRRDVQPQSAIARAATAGRPEHPLRPSDSEVSSASAPAPFDAFTPVPAPAPARPQPQAISAPLPTPDPASPPLRVTPAPSPRGRKPPGDDEFVDWVSGLGKD